MTSTIQTDTVTMPVKKTSVKTVAKASLSIEPTAAVSVAPTVLAKSEKLLKPKKLKLVRDSFTLPKLEYLMLETLKLRGSKLGSPVKKSDLLRAGIKALAAMPDVKFLATLKTVQSIKIGHTLKD